MISTSIVRHILTALAGILVSLGYADNSTAEMLVSALMTVAAVGWSIYEKVKT